MTALLVVEDNTTFAHTLIQFLRRFEGFTVAALAESAEDALNLLPEHCVDLAIIDVSLPGISGIELLTVIRRQYPEVRCLMLSGHHEHDYVRRALAAGALRRIHRVRMLPRLRPLEVLAHHPCRKGQGTLIASKVLSHYAPHTVPDCFTAALNARGQ